MNQVSLSTFSVRVVQFLSPVWHLVTPWTAAYQAVLHHLLEFAQTYVHWVSDAIQPSHSPSSLSPPAFSLSQHQDLFQWVCSLHQVAQVLELQLQHQSFQGIFRVDLLRRASLIDWFDVVAVQETLKSPLQHHSSKVSILQCSVFFIVQLSHLYMTTGKP